MKELMLNDYCLAKKTQTKKTLASFFEQKCFYVAGLSILSLIFMFFLINGIINHYQQLKTSERVLLLKNKKPMALVNFDLAHRQVSLTDLRIEQAANFDFELLQAEASATSQWQQNLLYVFLLNAFYDRSFDYTLDDLDRASLSTFFKQDKSYQLFLQDKNILWKEQAFDPQNPVLLEPVFTCPVALINTTPEAGLASTLAKILEKSSFSIIKKTSDNSNLTQSKIYYDQKQSACASLLTKLARIMPQSLVLADSEEVLQHRAALVIYLGQDLANLYNFLVERNLLKK